MTTDVLRVAVTGLGVSRSFIDNYLEAPETELVLLHDIDPARGRQASERFGVPSTTDFAELLASGADMVDVSTPNHLHPEQTVAALEAGKHVLCQKPMAPTVTDCRRMVDAAARTGRTLGMFMNSLSAPHAADLRRMVQEGYLGAVTSVRIRNAHRGPLRSKGPHGWRASKANIGGGSFMQLGVHPLNFVLWLLGEGVESVMGYADNRHCQHSIEGEDVTVAAGRLESGALIVMESGYASVGHALEIYGTQGHIAVAAGQLGLELARDFSGEVLEYRLSAKGGKTIRSDLNELDVRTAPRRAETNQQRAFARAVLAGKEPPTPGRIGLRDVAIIQAIYRSAESGRRVEVRELIEESGSEKEK